jgi:GNAT superfamily N-acetyltransferase
MASTPTAPARIHVAPVIDGEGWRHARRLVEEHIAWLTDDLGLDVRANQHDSEEELDSLAEFYALPHGRFLLGYVAGAPAGITGVHLMDGDTAELRRVWITPAARGNRLAPAMLQAGIETARSLGATRLWLETVSGHMDKAIAIYTKAGFRPIPHYSSLHETLANTVSLGLDLQ